MKYVKVKARKKLSLDEWRDLVTEVSYACNHKYSDIKEFFGDVLTDCNFHTEKKYILRYMDEVRE